MLDVLRETVEVDPTNDGERSMMKEVKLLKLIPLEVLKEKEGKIKVRIEYFFNNINEHATSLIVRHVHGQAVSDLSRGTISKEWSCPSPSTNG